MARPLILVADHNNFTRRSIRRALESVGMDVHEALSGAELIELAGDFRPNAIIVDKNLPGPAGANVIKSIRNEDGIRRVPIIVMEDSAPAAGYEGNVAAQHRDAYFAVVGKPFRTENIIESVQKALRSPAPDDSDNASEKSADYFQTADGAAKEVAGFTRRSAPKKLDEFTDNDFTRFQDFLLQKVGLYFDIKRKNDLGKALGNRMIALGISNFLDYFQYLNHSLHEERELKNLILYITIGETTFFRSPDQFRALREYILPRLIESRRSGMFKPSLRFWCAGCSTGEEPHSIAITLKEMIPDIDRWDIRISATDINQKFLEFAKEGLYPPRKVRFVRDDILRGYFVKEGDHYRVIPEIGRMVNFGYHNLSTDSYGKFDGTDVLLCRNVLIYFKRDRLKQIIDRFRSVMSDDGYLILGYSETLFQVSDEFRSIHYGDAFFYVRTEMEEKETGAVDHADDAKSPEGAVVKSPFDKSQLPDNIPDMDFTPVENKDATKKQWWEYFVGSDKAVGYSTIKDGEKGARSVRRSFPKKERVGTTPYEDGENIEALWEEGMNYYFYEQFDKAEDIFKKLMEQHHDSAKAMLGLGFIHANRGEDNLALDKINRSLDMDKLFPEAYFLRALIEEKGGDVEAAMADYRNVILLDQEFAMAHFNLGILYMKQNRLRDCRREFRNTLNILKSYDMNHSIKFSGGLHREALMQLCEDLSE